MIQSLPAEFRAAARQLRLHPGFTLGATLSLALGISLATAVFSVVHSVLGRPLGVGEPERLGEFIQVIPSTGAYIGGMGGAHVFVALREQASAFADVGAYTRQGAYFGELSEREGVSGMAVTRNMFDLLRVRPILGRGFEASDEGQDVTVLSHALWTTRFGSDTGIVGREIEAVSEGASKFRVLGVMPPTVELLWRNRMWFLIPDTTLTHTAQERTFAGYYSVIARLKPAATFALARAQTNSIWKLLVKDDDLRHGRDATIIPLREVLLSGLRDQLQLWTAAAILVLLLCAVNFATMSLSRGMRRRGELAVRAAIGATRGDLVRALVLEAMLLALLGGAIAALLGWWLVSFASVWFFGSSLPAQPVMDFTTIGFAVGAAMLVGFVFAVAPAIELAKVDLRSVLQGDASSSTSKRGEMFGRRALVALQLSLALTAVACVTALTQADRRFRNYSVRYDYDQLVQAWVSNRDGVRRPFDLVPMMEVARSAPGVERVAATGSILQALVWDPGGTLIDDPRTYITKVTPNLFETIGVSLVAGRMPTTDEIRAGGALLVSERLAKRIAETPERAAGIRLRMKYGRGAPRDWHTIYGVVPDIGGSLGHGWPMYLIEEPRAWTGATLTMVVNGDPKARVKEIAKVLKAADSRITATGVGSAKVIMDRALASTRGRNIFLAVTTALALVLAVIGVYGLTSYSTELRLREFGIRIALGASTPRLARTILADLWWMAAVGIGIGFYAAGELTHFLDTLYRMPWMRAPLVTLPIVPTAVSAATLVVIAIVGTAVPLRRVMRLDVMRTVQGGG